MFNKRWFSVQPVTNAVCYQVIPFARDDDNFIDDVRVLGNVLHRLRMPRRVHEAQELLEGGVDGVEIEAFDILPDATTWIAEYRARARNAE